MRRIGLAVALGAALACCGGTPGGAAGPPPVDAPPTDRFDAIVIDAGHGGEDEGARGPAGSRAGCAIAGFAS